MKSTKVKLWDAYIRLFHWALALSFAAAWGSYLQDWLTFHVVAGSGMLALVLSRISWAFVGPSEVRWQVFFPKSAVLRAHMWDMLQNKPSHELGHNPLAAPIMLVMLCSFLVSALSGFAWWGMREFSGPLAFMANWDEAWLKGFALVHDLSAEVGLVTVGFHLVGVALASVQLKENLPLSMITGYRRKPPPGP